MKMNTGAESADKIRQQTKDFIIHCSPDSYTNSRIYNTTKLLRALQTPGYRDVAMIISDKLYDLLSNHMIDGRGPIIDWTDTNQVKEIIKTELDRQAKAET